MATIFSKIINGDIPSYKVAESDKFYAFLDINPLAEGHTLVVPKVETDYLFDLDPAMLGEMMQFAQKVAKAQKKAIDCVRVGVAVLGFDVPHAHIHLVPLQSEAQMNFKNERVKLSDEQFKTIAQKIAAEVK
ncbi:MAG: HIT family protein [Marinilabiliaceae bacterium]|jgi:histidine triad (HIT) family protein|nr:HIT family protein [Bacteroidales bacterium]MCR5697936.1 HIT family protein [Marinilabiliaceae bacterium]